MRALDPDIQIDDCDLSDTDVFYRKVRGQVEHVTQHIQLSNLLINLRS